MAISIGSGTIHVQRGAGGKLVPVVEGGEIPSPPEQPQITASPVTHEIIRITLEEEVERADSVRLEVSSNGSDGWTTLTENLTSTYDHTGINELTQRYYRATAINEYGENMSDIATATTPETPPPPEPEEPVISTASGTFDQDQTVTLSGDKFGTKDQAAPVLADYVGTTYEHGTSTRYYDSIGEKEAFPESGSPYWQVRVGAAIARETHQRHPYSEATYFHEGTKKWQGSSRAYNVSEPGDTPYNTKYYVSWWMRSEHSPNCYWHFLPHPDRSTGTFTPGEPILIDGEEVGYIIQYDEEGVSESEIGHLHMILYDTTTLTWNWGRNDIFRGATLTGAESGATTVFPTEADDGTIYDHEYPGFKFCRIHSPNDEYEDQFYLVWADTDAFLSGHNGDLGEYRSKESINRNSILEKDKWHHLEVEINLEGGDEAVKIYFDHALWYTLPGEGNGGQNYPVDNLVSGPSLRVMGLDGKEPNFNYFEIDEFYEDQTRARIIVGTAPTYSELIAENDHRYEVQRPTAWDNTGISFAAHVGALDPQQPLYAYVFNADGVCNESGYPVNV